MGERLQSERDGAPEEDECGERPIAARNSFADHGPMFESIVDVVTASDWVYALILLIAALDAVFPVVPSEATVIAAASLAAGGELVLGFVLVAGATGAVIGDNVAYLGGRAGQGFLRRRLLSTPRWRQRTTVAERQLRERGGTIIAVSRFIPGGRTATMLTAGIVGLGWRRFAFYDVLAGLLWATYASVIGWIGGRAFTEHTAYALFLAFGIAAALTLVIEGGRRWVSRSS